MALPPAGELVVLEQQASGLDRGASTPGAPGTREFCTYLDTHYLDRALVLHESLRAHLPGARLRAVCFDELSLRALGAMGLPGLEAIDSRELEDADPEFRATRETRSPIEYLWTATPCVINWLLDRDGLAELTYLDADMLFFSSPKPFFDELGERSVLLTPASSAPQHYSRRLAERAGLFVVQFLTFRDDPDGREALAWWRERCIEHCSMHYSDGRMGDQKYLDDWNVRFRGTQNLAHPGMLGPWNIEAHEVDCGPSGVTIDGEPLVLYHFMGLRLYGDGTVRRAAGRFRITPEQRRWIYDPYVEKLEAMRRRIEVVEPGYLDTLTQHEPLRWRLQGPVSTAIGALARLRVRLFPRLGIGPYLEGAYVPPGYRADPDAIPSLDRPGTPSGVGSNDRPAS